ncbi:MAG: hypothetical protein EB023_06745 [Flavobacteriia bacterium]|nr:hypothetical protein [Flavobacteriia bacterium]
MADFKSNRKELDDELEKFMKLLEELLPRYHYLLRKPELSQDELTRLGEIEHYLIGVNAKIGNPNAKLKLERMRDAFAEALQTGEIMNFN